MSGTATPQEDRRNALAWEFRCTRRGSFRDVHHEMEQHLRADGSVIIEIRDPDRPQLPVHMERVLVDGTVVPDEVVEVER